MEISIQWTNSGIDTIKSIVDFDLTESNLIIYESPDKKTYFNLALIQGIEISGPEIEDEIEDRLEELQRQDRT